MEKGLSEGRGRLDLSISGSDTRFQSPPTIIGKSGSYDRSGQRDVKNTAYPILGAYKFISTHLTFCRVPDKIKYLPSLS